MLRFWTTIDAPYYGERDALLSGDYIKAEPTITHPIDSAQEGTEACIDGLTVAVRFGADLIDITDSMSEQEIDELSTELLGSYEQ